jgi:glycerol transport system ATP-binding protein
MYDGSVVQIGTPEELFETPAHTFVGQFIGSPGMNILKASVDGAEAFVDGLQVPLLHSYRKIDSGVELGIRPEYIVLSQTQGIQAETVSIDDVGKHIILRCKLGQQIVSVIIPEGQSIPDKPRLIFAQEKINIYQNAVLVRPADQ